MKMLKPRMWTTAWMRGVLLSARAQPVISIQPQSREVPRNGNTTLWGEAAGAGSLTCQWFPYIADKPTLDATNAVLILSCARQADAGDYWVRVESPEGYTWSESATLTLLSPGLPAFGTIASAPAFGLNGVGSNVDSLAFWETPEPTNTPLLATAKANDLLEVWEYPFQGHALPAKQFSSNINAVDGWELTHGRNPSVPGADEDPDQDQMTNLTEYWAGTSATNPASNLRVEAAALPGESALVLSFTAVADRSYAVESCATDLISVWTNWWSTAATGTNRLIQVTNITGDDSPRFFRLLASPTPTP